MCKKLTGYDGAHLNGEMNKPGVFLVATAKDFNNHVVPFALALVGTENYENWHWFMETVKPATGLDKITIISDRQKGLLSAVAGVYPSAGHRYCLRHIMDNINRSGAKLSIDDRRIICSMARSDCENDYKLFRSELLASKPKAVEYLDNIDQKHWAKHKFCETFGLPTFGEITSNLSEQANNWMGNEMRSSKPLDAFHVYFKRLCELTSEKRQLASKWISNSGGHRLVPLLQRELEDRAKAASMCAIAPLLDGAFSVQHLGPQSKHGYIHPWHVVDLPATECTCGNWKDEIFPCIHAICAAVHNGSRFEELYDKIRTSIGHFQDTYTFAFKPCPTDVTLESDSSMLVPHFQSDPDRIGIRGLKPGPKPSHKRKQARNAL